ncbi:NDH dependent flow 6 [Wolffia australiana]
MATSMAGPHLPGAAARAICGRRSHFPLRRVGSSPSERRLPPLRATPAWQAISDWPIMAVMVEHVAGQRDYLVHKAVWHLSDDTLKYVYTMYMMFTCWGCCFFGSTKDPFYDGETYRKDGGDGTVHWVYEKQEDIEEAARAELWREELIEEIELKVGGLRELEEAGREEQLVK